MFRPVIEIDYTDENIKELLQNPNLTYEVFMLIEHKIFETTQCHRNPNKFVVDCLLTDVDAICWPEFNKNPSLKCVDYLLLNPDKIIWYAFSQNTNEWAIRTTIERIRLTGNQYYFPMNEKALDYLALEDNHDLNKYYAHIDNEQVINYVLSLSNAFISNNFALNPNNRAVERVLQIIEKYALKQTNTGRLGFKEEILRVFVNLCENPNDVAVDYVLNKLYNMVEVLPRCLYSLGKNPNPRVVDYLLKRNAPVPVTLYSNPSIFVPIEPCPYKEELVKWVYHPSRVKFDED